MRLFTAIVVLVSILLLAFSAFGFLACYELDSVAARLPWQIFYVALATGAGFLGWRVVRRAKRPAGHNPNGIESSSPG